MIVTLNPKKERTIDSQSEEQLIKNCQSGSRFAFREIYNRYSIMLFSVATRILGNKEEAEDALQNTFVNLYNHIGEFGFQAKFSTYLTRILINNCYDIINKRGKMRLDIQEDNLHTQNTQDWKLSLERAIHQLPEKMRECFILFAIEGFKQKEIAEMMELNEGTVKAHIFQAKVKLRQLLS